MDYVIGKLVFIGLDVDGNMHFIIEKANKNIAQALAKMLKDFYESKDVYIEFKLANNVKR